MHIPRHLATFQCDFLSCERGAISVDYVVLVAGGLALGIAVTNGLFSGYRGYSSAVQNELENRPTTLSGGGGGDGGDGSSQVTQTVYSGNFNDGSADGWYSSGSQSASTKNVDGIGGVLGPVDRDNGMVGRTFTVPDGADSAELTFDVYSLDGIEGGETGDIYINNTKVAEIAHQDNGKAFFREIDHGIDGLTVSAETVADDVDLPGFSSSKKDSKFTVKVTQDDPGKEMRFEFQTELSASYSDESFALDNVNLTSIGDP